MLCVSACVWIVHAMQLACIFVRKSMNNMNIELTPFPYVHTDSQVIAGDIY